MSASLRLVQSHPVPLAFLVLCAGFAPHADLSLPFVATEMTSRLARNLVLTLSLVIPVVAGLGLNFGIVLGAMAGQAGLILVRSWRLDGFPGFLCALALATPLAVVLGVLMGLLLNRAKGREMITGIIAAFFANGVYTLVFLFLAGSWAEVFGWLPLGPGAASVLAVAAGGAVVAWCSGPARAGGARTGGAAPAGLGLVLCGAAAVAMMVALARIDDRALVLPRRAPATSSSGVPAGDLPGMGLRTSIDLDWAAIAGPGPAAARGSLTYALDGLLPLTLPLAGESGRARDWPIPVGTFVAAGLVCWLIRFLLDTKLGADMRAMGQDMHIAGVLGIEADRTRIVAIVISTVLAAWGQLVFLQNLGTLNVYSSHEQVGMMAVAALLIGGASAAEARIGHALAGTFLLHLLMLVSARAGPNLFPDNPSGAAQLGEYVRCTAAYGVIALALALHAFKEARRRALELGERL
jgi:simple sugar transport system permease protein